MKRLIAILVLISTLAWPQTGGWTYAHLTQATANNSLSTSGATLHTIVVNSTTAGTFVITDTASASCAGGTAVTGTVTPAANSMLTYDVTVTKGLCITTGGTIDLTVSWKY